MTTFAELGVPGELIERLAAGGILEPSRAQAVALPPLLEGRDATLIAPTGTGKTLAYLLPMLYSVDWEHPVVQGVVLVPTQELGIQVRDVARAYTGRTASEVLALVGGANPARQAEALKKLPRIVVGTPGRVREMVRTGKLTLHGVRVAVVDEADHMLDPAKGKDVAAILQALPKGRQLVFCSATLPEAEAAIANRYLNDPVALQAEQTLSLPEGLQHLAFVVPEREKLDMLRKLVRHFDTAAIAFVSQGTDLPWAVSKLEHQHFAVAGLSGSAPKLERAAIMRDFKAGKLQLLVATDLAARGLDLSAVGMVVNLELPTDPQHYVHRVGRTARMGRSGVAVTLATPKEAFVLDKIEKALGFTFERPVYRFGEVREATEAEAKRAEAPPKKAKPAPAEAAEPKPKPKKPKAKGPTAKAAAKGKARKAQRKAAGQWKAKDA